jgi:hypothetical protein
MLVELAPIRKAKKHEKFLRFLDAKASHAALEVCLFSLEINNLQELNSLKMHIKKVMQELEKIEDGEKESI